MATVTERYAAAVHSKSLTVDERTAYSDTDVLAAYGIADRNLERGFDGRGRSFTPAPLAVPLERLFAGDHKAAHEIVLILAGKAFMEARRLGVKLSQPQAHDMACMMLAWFRNGTCQPCGGRGKPTIKDSPVMTAHDCDHCLGTGKILFYKQFRYEWKPLAEWLKDEMDRACARAAPAAMRFLRDQMDLTK